MKWDPGVSSSLCCLVPEWGRTLDWALTSGFLHDRRTANAGCCVRPRAGTDRRLSRRLEGCRGFSGNRLELSHSFKISRFFNHTERKDSPPARLLFLEIGYLA